MGSSDMIIPLKRRNPKEPLPPVSCERCGHVFSSSEEPARVPFGFLSILTMPYCQTCLCKVCEQPMEFSAEQVCWKCIEEGVIL